MQMHRTPPDIIDNLNLQTFGNVQGTVLDHQDNSLSIFKYGIIPTKW
jgi:hypothetical protein